MCIRQTDQKTIHLYLEIELIMTNLDSIFKSRDITLPTKVRLVKAMVFPVMYGCESWTVKKAECRRIDAFEIWCWRRLLRVPWTARRSNQSILKEISPGISLEGLMLKLKLQYFGHCMWSVDSLEKTLMLGGIGAEGERTTRMRWLNGIIVSMDVSLSEFWELVMDRGGLACCNSWGHKELNMTERLSWTEVMIFTLFTDHCYFLLCELFLYVNGQSWLIVLFIILYSGKEDFSLYFLQNVSFFEFVFYDVFCYIFTFILMYLN